MDNPIIFKEETKGRFTVRNDDGKFFVLDKENKFPRFFVESGDAKKIKEYLVENEIIKDSLKEEIKDLNKKNNELLNKLNLLEEKRDNKYNNHYLIKAMVNECDDQAIEELIENRLPNNFTAFSDNKFLVIQEKMTRGMNFNEYTIAKLIDIPTKSFVMANDRTIGKSYYKVFYYKWETILDKESIIGD